MNQARKSSFYKRCVAKIKPIQHVIDFSRRNVSQLFVIFTVLTLFVDFAFISPFTDKLSFYKSPKSYILGLFSLNTYYLFLIHTLVLRLVKKINKIRISPVIIPVLIFSIIRSLFFDQIPRWDSAVYFNALTQTIPRFDMTLKSFVGNFNWYEHPTMGFALVTSLVQFFQPTSLSMLNLSSLILGITAIYSFYKICVYFAGKNNKIENLLITILFAVNPLFVAVSTAYVPDFGVLVFFLATFASFVYNKLLLTFFLGTLLVFSKETGALSYGTFVFAYLLLISGKQWLKLRKVDWPQLASLFGPLILLITYFQLRKWDFWSSGGNATFFWGNNCQFCFGINSFNILQNLMVFFVANFNWILSLFILANIVKQEIFYPHGYNSIKSDAKKCMFRILKYVFAVFIIFFMIYVIYVVPSYLTLSSALLILVFYISLRNLVGTKLIRILTIATIALLFCLQIFKTVDPVSKFVFGTYKVGNHEILKIGTGYMGDGMIYNTQYIYIDRLLTKLIKEFDITFQDNIFMDPYAWGDWYFGWGRFVDTRPNILYKIDEIEDWPTNIYFLGFPFEYLSDKDEYRIRDGYLPPLIETETVLNQLKTRYRVLTSKKIDINGYWIMVYKLSKEK